MWQTSVQGNLRVRDALVPWIGRGWLGEEKREQYFDAVASCRRARRVFISIGRRRPTGKAREAFS